MRCLSCNKILSSFESTRKYRYSKEFVDLCNLCYAVSGLTSLSIEEREDLKDFNDEIQSEPDDV